MKKFFYFLLVSLLSALVFESIPTIIFPSKTFSSALWLIPFVLWYGLLFSISFLIFRKKPVFTGFFNLVYSWSRFGKNSFS